MTGATRAAFRAHVTRILLAVVLMAAGGAMAQAAPAPWRSLTTPSGLTLWVAPDPGARDVVIQATWRGGSDGDPPRPQQLSATAMAMMTEGAGDLDAVAFGAALDDLSADLVTWAERETVSASLTAPPDKIAAAAALFHLALTAPRFSPSDGERLRRTLKADVAEAWTEPGLMASVALARIMLPGHPRLAALLKPGEEPPVIPTDTLRAWARARLARDNLVLAVAGAITPEDAATLVDGIIGGLPDKARLAPPPARAYRGAGTRVVVPREGDQTLIAVSAPAPSGDDADGIAADLLSDVLGSGPTSRLFRALREAKGLTYGIEAVIQPSDQGGLLLISTSVPNDKAAEVLDVIGAELDRLAEAGVPAEELADLRARRRAAHGADLTGSAVIAGEMIFDQLRHRAPDDFAHWPDRVDGVDKARIDAVARRWFAASRATIALVGQPLGLDALPRVTVP